MRTPIVKRAIRVTTSERYEALRDRMLEDLAARRSSHDRYRSDYPLPFDAGMNLLLDVYEEYVCDNQGYGERPEPDAPCDV